MNLPKWYTFDMQTSLILLTMLLFVNAVAAQQAHVTTVSPQAHSMVSAGTLEISVTFDIAIDPASVTTQTFSVFGRWTGVCQGNYQFEDGGRTIRFRPQREISAGEWVTVSISKGMRTIGGAALAQGYAWNFWTVAAVGTLDLVRSGAVSVRRPGEGLVRTYGAYAGDLDEDGYHDFTVPNEETSDVRIFLNDGSGGYGPFKIVNLPANMRPSTNEGADFNGDGHIDFATGNIDGNSSSILFGDGNGSLRLIETRNTGGQSRGLCTVDLNFDGAPDIVTANRTSNNISILLNRGDGTFEAGTNLNTLANQETACAAADFNEDGIMDVVVGGHNFDSNGDIVILLGDGNGGLIFSSRENAGGACWMLAVGDVNGDHHVDVLSANSSSNRFAVLVGDGNGGLSNPTTYPGGQFMLAIDTGDIDGDGDLDVAVSNFISSDWILFENNGSGVFSNPRTFGAGRAGSCGVLHDRDRDGDLDMTGIDELNDELILFSNPSNPTSVDTDSPPIAQEFRLLQSYPNPFFKRRGGAGETQITIPFRLQRPAHVVVELFNIRGQHVQTLLDANFAEGRFTASLNPDDLPAGLYVYRLHTGNVTLSRKLLLFP